MSLPDPEVVKMNIASSITVTAISSNDNCIMSPISLDHLFPHSDKNISTPRPLLKFSSSFFSALSLYPPSLFQLSEPGISFWLNDFFFALWERCHGDCAPPTPSPQRARGTGGCELARLHLRCALLSRPAGPMCGRCIPDRSTSSSRFLPLLYSPYTPCMESLKEMSRVQCGICGITFKEWVNNEWMAKHKGSKWIRWGHYEKIAMVKKERKTWLL